MYPPLYALTLHVFPFHSSEETGMRRAQLIGGLLLAVAAGILFVAGVDVPVSVPIALLIVGIASIATSRRRR